MGDHETSVTAVIQARMSSTRLPGKVMLPLSGAPMLQRQLERVQQAHTLTGIVVATSSDISDDPIEELCRALNVDCYRGDLTNVLARFTGAIAQFPTDVVVRITADCPLISPAVIDSVVEEFLHADCDYLSNTLEPSYPDGLDVEVMRAQALLDIDTSDRDPLEQEHVTLGIYRQPERFSVRNFTGPQDLSHLRWTVDSPEDYEFAAWVYRELYLASPNFELSDVLKLLDRNPDRSRTTSDAKRNAALDGVETGAMKHS